MDPAKEQALVNAFADVIAGREPHGRRVVSCWMLATGPAPALLLLPCAVAFAQDGGPAVPGAASSMPSADFLLSMGPCGALVWSAYLLWKGVKVMVHIDLSGADREIIEELGRGGTVVAD